MEKAVAKHLGKKHLHAIGGQHAGIYPQRLQALYLINRHALHALHHNHVLGAKIPIHFRNQYQRVAGCVAAQLGGIARFAHQVQLVVQVFVEFFHHLAGFEAARVSSAHALDPACHPAHEAGVFFHHRQQIGAQHFDGHFAANALAINQRRKVHLRDRGAGHRLAIELHEQTIQRFAKGALDGGNSHLSRKRRHAVLQLGQLGGDVGRQQVAPGGKHLAELDEKRAEFFERHAQPLATGRIQIAPQCDQAAKGTQAGLGRRRQRQFVQPVAEKNPENIDATQQLHAGLTPDVARQPVHRSSHRWAYP